MAKEPILKLELYLVRHGQSQGNVGYEGCEPTEEDLWDPKLTGLGQKQADLLGKRFSEIPLDCVIASPYSRATETGYAVVTQQPPDGSHVLELHPLFCECGTGDPPGKTLEEIQKTYPNVCLAPGAEGFERLVYCDQTNDDEERLARGRKMLGYLLDRFQHGEKVMVAAHACFNTFLIFAALGLTTDLPFDFSNGNTGLTKIRFYEKGSNRYGDTVLVYHNDQSHLYLPFKGVQLDET